MCLKECYSMKIFINYKLFVEGSEEMGGVRCIWESLKNHTESVGLAHTQVNNWIIFLC